MSVIVKTLGTEKLKVNLLASGDIHSITYDNFNVSLYRATSLAGGIANIFLRINDNGRIAHTPLIGAVSPATAEVNENGVIYKGVFDGVEYEARLDVGATMWFWTVTAKSARPGLTAELFYGQDVGLCAPNMNEAYVAQYLDHRSVFEEGGFHIVTKQNQWPELTLRQGALTGTVSYATDGFDFFGTEYKRTNVPRALRTGELPGRVYQYELAYVAFKTESMPLDAGIKAVFYGVVRAGAEAAELVSVREAYANLPAAGSAVMELALKPEISWQAPYPYVPFSPEELEELFPERDLEEKAVETSLSWFTPDGAHYMTGAKEELTERPAGHIIANHAFGSVSDRLLSSTNYIYGVFNSLLSFGNTQFNRLLTYKKTQLNILKTSGQRLFVKINRTYRLLAMPAVYKVTVNSAAWYYKIDDDVLLIEAVTASDEARLALSIRSLHDRPYDFLLTNELALGEVEGVFPAEYEITDNVISFRFPEDALASRIYPEYWFRMCLEAPGVYRFYGDERFFAGKGAGNPLLTAEVEQASRFSIMIEGLTDALPVAGCWDIENWKEEFTARHRADLNSFALTIDAKNENAKEIRKINYLAYWYLHNALIHYAVPHGLEQYGGGAWGTRDVCQGPAEMFSALKRHDLVREIILAVYARQFYETGDWPQWFMFDRYRFIQADSSHGDIIVWPLHLLGKYLRETDDAAVLARRVPYTEKATGKEIGMATIAEHVKRQLDTIEANLIPGTALSAYGGGDWNDTLQPVDGAKKEVMASGWTVALTIEALEAVGEFIADERINSLANRMKADYHKYLIKDRVPAGFALIGTETEHMLHPSDRVTGVKYRLLSFNRGMIAELFPEEDLPYYLELIDRYLLHPDGARLMDQTVTYRGGNPRIFVRAETAANFGREIGLLYVHAHLRYCEAMSKLGEAERLFSGIKVVNPILIGETVKNARPRQSNLYFSSSDGGFTDRYEANRDFGKLRTGEVPVKGGWRLYSSGPGIWLNLIIANFLGIKHYQGDLYIDPVLPKSLSGLRLFFRYDKSELEIEYDITGTCGVEYLLVNGEKITNNTALSKYRRSGVIVPRGYLQEKTKIIVKM